MSTFDKLPPMGQPNPNAPKVPYVFGLQQAIESKYQKSSRLSIRNPGALSNQATSSVASGNGTTSFFNTSLTPQTPHGTEMNFAIPYMTIYWNTAGVGSLQIWPNIGSGITPGAFTTQAWFDWHAFSATAPGSVISQVSGAITNVSGGNGTLQLVTQWKYLSFNSGTVA